MSAPFVDADSPSESSSTSIDAPVRLATGSEQDRLQIDFLATCALGVSGFGSHQAHDLWLMDIRGGIPLETNCVSGRVFQGRLDLVGSLFAGGQDRPEAAYLVGLGAGRRYEFTAHERWRPYLIGTFGIGGTDIGHPDLSGTFQFHEQGGVGIRYRLAEHHSLLSEVTYLHVSNGGISEPNDGLNAVLLSIGYGWSF